MKNKNILQYLIKLKGVRADFNGVQQSMLSLKASSFQTVEKSSFIFSHKLPNINFDLLTSYRKNSHSSTFSTIRYFSISTGNSKAALFSSSNLSQAEKYYYNGLSLEKLREFKEALIEYNLALQVNPKFTRAWLGKGNVLMGQGNTKEAIQCFSQAIKLDSNYALAWSNKGYALSTQGKYAEAIQYFDRALSSTLEDKLTLKVTWSRKGHAFSMQNEYNKAIQCFDQALTLDSSSAPAWYSKGDVLNKQGKYEEALKCFDQAILLNPGNKSDICNNKGNVLASLGKYNEALECYNQVLALDSECTDAWNNKGNVLLLQGRYNQAIECYDQVIALDPQHAIAWNNKGDALLNQDKHKEAIKCYERAIEFEPQYVTAWVNKGNAYFYLNHFDEANKNFDKALAIDANNIDAQQSKALYLYKQNEVEKALALLMQAEQRLIEEEKSYVFQADFYTVSGKLFLAIKILPKAIDYFQKALNLFPNCEQAKAGLLTCMKLKAGLKEQTGISASTTPLPTLKFV